MVQKWLAVILVVLVAAGNPVIATDAGDEGKEGKPVPVLKVIPGADQLKNGKWLKGTLLLGAFCTAVAGAFIQNRKGNDTYELYLASINVDEILSLRGRTQDHFRARNYYIGGILAVFLLHVLDLSISGGKKGIKSEIAKDRLAIGLYYSF